MKRCIRQISEDIYRRAKENGGRISDVDVSAVWSRAEQVGYGIYGHKVYEQDGKYFVEYELGESCD